MMLNELILRNFRNYIDQHIQFSDHINVITGPNAQGKTNLLEAVFFLSRGYSHRAAALQELACFFENSGDDFHQDDLRKSFFLEGEITRDSIHHHLTVKYDRQKKTVLLNGKKERKQEDVSRIISTILFEPEDLRIVKAGPDKRRYFMDEEISGFLPAYQQVLKQYKKILFQRNALLKEIAHRAEMIDLLDSWDGQLVQYGSRLIVYRVQYLKKLGPYAGRLHYLLSGGKEKLTLFYQNNVMTDLSQIDLIEQIFMEGLHESRKRDLERGSTGIGPHVDDIMIQIDGKDARRFASQGQQRTAAIAMKLSQIDIFKANTGDYPIVLLDDILSELDDERQEKILSILGKTQAFITCTDDHFAQYYDPEQIKTLHIFQGNITE